MSWTRADTKDVMKKAVGTMIAAAFISAAGALFDMLTPLIFSLIMVISAAIIFVIILLAKSEKEEDVEATSTSSVDAGTLQQPTNREPQRIIFEYGPRAGEGERRTEPSTRDVERSEVDEKAKKHEYKLKKKELKAKKKAMKESEKESEKE